MSVPLSFLGSGSPLNPQKVKIFAEPVTSLENPSCPLHSLHLHLLFIHLTCGHFLIPSPIHYIIIILFSCYNVVVVVE